MLLRRDEWVAEKVKYLDGGVKWKHLPSGNYTFSSCFESGGSDKNGKFIDLSMTEFLFLEFGKYFIGFGPKK